VTKVLEDDNGIRVVILEDESDQKCELCGEVEECRPYGPDFKQICFKCGTKDEEGTLKRMHHLLFGVPL
jgi:hypothetical protein